ncbi:hypothetical protein CJO75_01120 [Ralstonia solanacearum]|nr:hypothetical protein CJO75_01120 [Ralstonia solanacearum]
MQLGRCAQCAQRSCPQALARRLWLLVCAARREGLKTGIHRLVALTFLGPPPSRQHEVAHNDGNRANNIVTNLRWATHAENVADTFRHGTAKVPVYRGRTIRVPH